MVQMLPKRGLGHLWTAYAHKCLSDRWDGTKDWQRYQSPVQTRVFAVTARDDTGQPVAWFGLEIEQCHLCHQFLSFSYWVQDTDILSVLPSSGEGEEEECKAEESQANNRVKLKLFILMCRSPQG